MYPLNLIWHMKFEKNIIISVLSIFCFFFPIKTNNKESTIWGWSGQFLKVMNGAVFCDHKVNLLGDQSIYPEGNREMGDLGF